MPEADTAQKTKPRGIECSKVVPILDRTVGKRIGEGMSGEKSSLPLSTNVGAGHNVALRQVGESRIILPIGAHGLTGAQVTGAKPTLPWSMSVELAVIGVPRNGVKRWLSSFFPGYWSVFPKK